MKKTVNINLSGIVFTIDEDAYARLQTYLTDLERHFAGFDDKSEIIADIENRMAEHFSSELKNATPIGIADVERMIDTMGHVEDLESDPSDEQSRTKEESTESGTTTKRLYRNPDEAMLAGVCSGIAVYFGIDPVLVRLLFVLLLFTGGFSIVLYIILIFIMPKADTPIQKSEMYGKPVTIKDMGHKVKTMIEKAKKNFKKNQ